MDGTGYGLGLRSQRYAVLLDNGVIKHLNVETAPGVDASIAETMLSLL
jgi:peroxiredoxin